MTEESVNPVSLARPPQRPWLRAFLLTSAVFGSGLIVGMVLTSTVLWQRAFNPFRQPPGFAVERLMNDMQDELLLSPDQSRQLKDVVSSHNERMKAIRDEVDPKIQNELESLRKQVDGVLRPEQAKRWNERYDDMQRRFMHFGPPGAPPGPDRGRRPPGLPGDDMRGPRPGDDMRGPRPGDDMRGPRPGDDMRGPRPQEMRPQQPDSQQPPPAPSQERPT